VQPGIATVPLCLQLCFLRSECRSVNYNRDQDVCILNRGVRGSTTLLSDAGTVYYERYDNTDELLGRRLAELGTDFQPAVTMSVIFEDGQSTGVINVTVLSDMVPELSEMFTVTLTAVTGILTPVIAVHSPALGRASRTQSSVTIKENQDPHGVIAFDQTDSSVMVMEADDSQVSLVVRRSGGLLGAVGVVWSAALPLGVGDDLQPLAGSVLFADGEDVKTILIDVVNDATPELAEQVQFSLAVTSGGARTGLRTLQVVILGNDDASGRFAVADSQQIQAAEGNANPVLISIARTVSLLANVSVDWSLRLRDPVTGALADASADFQETSGSVVFAPDQAWPSPRA